MMAFVLRHPDMADLPPIETLVVKNKMQGLIRGQWGWYYHRDRRVVLIVPRELKFDRSQMRYTKREIILHSRAEFVIAVLAHELRHHYQYHRWNVKMGRWRLLQTQEGKLAREVDAEIFELKVLEMWREAMKPQGVLAG